MIYDQYKIVIIHIFGIFTLYMLYVCISAGQRLIAINRIQNKSLFLHNICVCTVYNYFVYINTHTCLYIFKKYVHVYIVCIFIHYLYYI